MSVLKGEGLPARGGYLAGYALAAIQIEVAHHDVRTLFGEPEGDTPAHALGATGDDRYFVLKQHHSAPSSGESIHTI